MAMPAICSIGPKLFVVHLEVESVFIETSPYFFDFPIICGKHVHGFVDKNLYNKENVNYIFKSRVTFKKNSASISCKCCFAV